MISFVIPTHNDTCVTLVEELARQAAAIEGLDWEIVVADDASTDEGVVRANQVINAMPHCRYMRREENVGRARIRNVLAEEARGEWLLYIDGDAQMIIDDYIKRYIEAGKDCLACYGGYRMMPGPEDNLRWKYEYASAPKHRAEQRRNHPYKSFNISNLLIKRELVIAHPLDRRFSQYGYEDVLLGKQLQDAGIGITHIDAPVGFFDYESNASYVAKTEEGLQTLYRFRKELKGYSTLLETVSHMGNMAKWAFGLWFRLMKQRWRSNLCGTSPSLLVFKLYKLGYYLNLSRHAKDRST